MFLVKNSYNIHKLFTFIIINKRTHLCLMVFQVKENFCFYIY